MEKDLPSLAPDTHNFLDFPVPVQDEVINILGMDINCVIDEKKTQVSLFTREGIFIGKMYAGSFWIGSEEFDHNGIEIEEEFRSKGYAKILFRIFTDNSNFGKLKEEYCRRKDMYYFYTSVGYGISEIYDKNGRSIIFDEEEIDEYFTQGYTIKLKLLK